MITIKYEDFSANYDLFVKLCEITSEPVKLIKDGKSSLLIMNAEAYERRKKMLDLREKILNAGEEASVNNSSKEVKAVTLKELEKYLSEIK